MSKIELLKQAFDANAWTYDTSSYAQAVSPAMYDEMVRSYEEKKLVVAPLGEQYDFTKPGHSWTVTIDGAPGAAAAVSETDSVSYTAITNRQVTFTPSEYAAAFQSSYTAMEDGFLDFMANATKKIGYMLSQKKDALAVSTLVSDATTAQIANGKSATTDLTDTDLFSREEILKARNTISGTYYYTPKSVIMAPIQEANLLNEGSIYKANEFGTRSAIADGVIGNLYGMDLYVSDSITATSNVVKAIVLGESISGEQAFGHAFARKATIEMDKDIDHRQLKVVGSERYQFKVLHPDAVVTVASYNAI